MSRPKTKTVRYSRRIPYVNKVCPYCGKTLKTNAAYRAHIRKHTAWLLKLMYDDSKTVRDVVDTVMETIKEKMKKGNIELGKSDVKDIFEAAGHKEDFRE